jgi:hypothetical protein
MFTTLPTSLARRAARVLAYCAVPLAALALGAPAASAKPKVRSIACKGGSSSCVATVNLAGGASNVKLKIALTDTNLKLVSVTAKPKEVKGAYSLSKGTYSLGGSVYTTTLNAVQSIRKGATLTLKFAVKK